MNPSIDDLTPDLTSETVTDNSNDEYFLSSKSDCIDSNNAIYFSSDNNQNIIDNNLLTNNDRKKKHEKNRPKSHHHRSSKCRKNHRKRCCDNCEKKHCKYCKILGSSPYHLGAQMIVANEIETIEINANHGTFNELRVGNQKISFDIVQEKHTERYTINDIIDPLTNRTFWISSERASLDDLSYKGEQPAPKGGLVFFLGLNKRSTIEDIIFKPTLRNNISSNVQIETSLIVAKTSKGDNNQQIEYDMLDHYRDILMTGDTTIRLFWKGPLPADYLSGDNIYLFIMINSHSDGVAIIDVGTPDITIVY